MKKFDLFGLVCVLILAVAVCMSFDKEDKPGSADLKEIQDAFATQAVYNR